MGKHASALTDKQLKSIKDVSLGGIARSHHERSWRLEQTVLAAILLFFVSQGCIMLAYNMLVRKTARSKLFFRSVDALSGILAMWFLANVIVIGMSLSSHASPPVAISSFWLWFGTIFWHSQYWFLVASAALTICLWMGQLLSFVWIVWSTSTRLPVKIRWSISIGLFVPYVWLSSTPTPSIASRTRILTTRAQSACLGAIITRLAILPPDLFANDWTFTSINTILAFICEILFSVMNLLAPSLPVFFDQTSTGGLHYVPGNNNTRTNLVSSGQSQTAGGGGSVRTGQNSRAKSGIDSRVREDNDLVELSKTNGMFSTSIRRQEERRRTSFDSDAILVRRSVDIR
jgi:signal transduction histidine kinase